ncbi:MAG: DUF1385 domain-containing protein [Fimbriimonadaceae bacterium]|nr:DUF1385 domain-containing protein [Fimbriimonadaceae bacterium]
MTSYPLHFPVGALMCPVEPMQAEDSLQLAANRLRDEGLTMLPVARGRTLVGALTNKSLASAIGSGIGPLSPVELSLERDLPTIAPYQTCADALRLLGDTGADGLVVVDDANQVLGVFSARDLIAPSEAESRPRLVGGMATPFGVYLTNGAVTGGAPKWALMVTGAVLFTLFLVSSLAADGIDFLTRNIAISTDLRISLLSGIAFVFFMLGLRLMPLAGIHAAEHMVVHAIERGEPLTPQVVERMPRVHPRCGTNFATAAMLFLGIAGSTWIPDQELRVLLGGLVALILWRPLGSLLQFYVTTRRPNKKQIDMGIEAGQQLLANYQKAHAAFPSIWLRLWNSGMPQIIMGSLAAGLVLEGLAWSLGYHDLVRVYF